jgi:hypothetical protein
MAVSPSLGPVRSAGAAPTPAAHQTPCPPFPRASPQSFAGAAGVAEAHHAAPVSTVADVLADPHVRARGSLVEVDGVMMPGPVARLEATPGAVRHPGRPLGADTAEVLAELDTKP